MPMESTRGTLQMMMFAFHVEEEDYTDTAIQIHAEEEGFFKIFFFINFFKNTT